MRHRYSLTASSFLVILAGCGGGGPSASSGSTSGSGAAGGSGGSGGSGGDASTSSSASAGGQNQGGMGGAGGQGQGGMGVCVPGAPAPCYSGPPGTLGVGICAAGTKTCLDDGSGFSECTGEILPRVELAGTPEDEDCSGGDDCSDKVILSFRLGADVPPPAPQPQPYPYDEEIFAAAVTSAGDTLIHGRVYGTYEYAPGKTVGTGAFFMRIDPLGVVKNAFDLPSPYPKSLFAAPDGGFFLFWSDLAGAFEPAPHYLARYDAADQLVYQKTFMIPTLRMASLVTLPDGHILVLGSWRGSATLDAATLQGPLEYDSLYFAELDASGKWLWAKTFAQMDRASGSSLLLDASSNDVYLSGTFGGYHVAGGISLGGDWLKAPVYHDGFYGRLTASGGHVWSKHVTQQGEAWGTIAAIAPDGSVLLTGGDARQVPDVPTAIDLGLGIVDVDDARFLARVSADGTTMSTVVTKAIQFDGLSPVAGGRIHFVSSFQSQGTVDVLGKPAASHSGSSDFMIGTIGATNELEKACIYGAASKETGRVAGISPDGSYVVIGSFEGALDLGKGPMTSVGASDLFVAKIQP